MTRINLVDPSILTDKHLMAEYRELPRIFTAVAKDPERAMCIEKPEKYVLGAGHVKFFYDKLKWLNFRYRTIIAELLSRGFNLDRELYTSVLKDVIRDLMDHKDLYKWYQPTPEEIYLNMTRLVKRSKLERVAEELSQ